MLLRPWGLGAVCALLRSCLPPPKYRVSWWICQHSCPKSKMPLRLTTLGLSQGGRFDVGHGAWTRNMCSEWSRSHPSFDACMATSYSSFVHEPAGALPSSFHSGFRECLHGINNNKWPRGRFGLIFGANPIYRV